MKTFLALFIFASLSLNQAVLETDSIFEEANAAYAEGNYQAAVEAYELILSEGDTSSELHYNLANAHYKLNHIGPSIYHYEKALLLDPNDRDIRNNLQFAQNMTVDAIEEAPRNTLTQWWQSVLGSFGPTGWATSAIVWMVVFVLLFLGFYFSTVPLRKRIFFLTAMASLFFSLTSVALGFVGADQIKNQRFAVVYAEEVGINSEPNARGEALFFLHEGTKVKLLEDFQEWSKIELANGNQGWVHQEAIKKL